MLIGANWLGEHVMSAKKVNKQNLLVNSDNIVAMQKMKSMGLKVKHIFVDPPYGTGSGDFRYSDNSDFELWQKQMGYVFSLGHQLMLEDGVCAVCIDDNNYAYLKIILDEIFGRSNYIGTFIWKKSHTVKNDSKTISTQHEHILMYAKDIKKVQLNRDQVSQEYVDKSYRHQDEKGVYRTVPLHKKKNTKVFPITSKYGKVWELPWNYNEVGMDKLIADDMIEWGKTETAMPAKKVYLKPMDEMTKTYGTILNPELVGYTGDGGRDLKELGFESMDFLYAKPVKLYKFILGIFMKDGDTVLDFFAGSGTTGHAVMVNNSEKGQNCKFILITNNENGICESITKPRIDRCISINLFNETFVYEMGDNHE